MSITSNRKLMTSNIYAKFDAIESRNCNRMMEKEETVEKLEKVVNKNEKDMDIETITA